ncbi:hypothetical protein [Allorhizocola rhizosphaerae]|uniref:hypothetical protein n=1 Tax=Allorhizocola rhizosphaerae TaxID=1872709 RepID=UPI000E3D6268|nr:hypothetical protein [Allorhizocola rhizosphaerae]
MTALTDGTTAQAKPADRFVRLALRWDAIASGLTGVAFIGTPQMQKDLFGLPAAFTLPVGLFLLAFAGLVWFAGVRRPVSPALVRGIIALNVLWVVGCAAVIAFGLLPLTGLGIAYVALQGIVVGAFAELEWVGLRRVRRAGH